MKDLIEKLPELNHLNFNDFMRSDEIIKETYQQIQKDLGMFGIDLSFSGNIENSYNELHSQLIKIIENLIQNHYSTLLSLLYRIDISENEISKAEKAMPDYSHTEVLAHQIIFREFKKVVIRKYYSNVSK